MCTINFLLTIFALYKNNIGVVLNNIKLILNNIEKIWNTITLVIYINNFNLI